MPTSFWARFGVVLPWMLELLAPRECAACGGVLAGDSVFCSACGPPVAAASRELAGVPLVVAGTYAPPLSRAVGRLKFDRHSELAPALASLLVARVRLLGIRSSDVWAPVPLHPRRLVERGFNQAALLARALCSRAGGRFEPRMLERIRETEQQARLSREERVANMHGAFRVPRPHPGRRVLLVDDVVTTGRTAAACLESLRGAGSEVLAVIAVAQAGTEE